MIITGEMWEATARADRIRAATAPEIRSAKLRRLHAWWQLHATHGMPRLVDFDVTEHWDLMPHLLFIRVIPDSSFIFSIVGSRVAQWLSRDREGYHLTAADPSASLRGLWYHLEQVRSSREPWLMAGTVEAERRQVVSFEGLDCPLADRRNHVIAIIGILDVLGPASQPEPGRTMS